MYQQNASLCTSCMWVSSSVSHSMTHQWPQFPMFGCISRMPVYVHHSCEWVLVYLIQWPINELSFQCIPSILTLTAMLQFVNHLESSAWNNQQSSAETVNHPVLYWQHLKYQPFYKLISLSSVKFSTGIQDDWVKVRHLVHDSHMWTHAKILASLSVSSGFSKDQQALKPNKVLIIWPNTTYRSHILVFYYRQHVLSIIYMEK